jgi:hypothetical protein
MLKRTLSAIILAAAFLANAAIVPSYAQEPSQTGQQQDDKMKDDKMAGDKMQSKKGKHKKAKKSKDADKMDRGRTASYPTAPAQIPACSFPAPGSS